MSKSRILSVASMYINAIREKKILTNISEFAVDTKISYIEYLE